jgi:antibiotic biosynthesis monooxygenase (ABM) superfamily enzyme
VASNIFYAREAPRYQTALIVNMAFPVVAIVLNVLYSLYLRHLNRKMDKEQGPQEHGQAPFRYQT